MMILLSFTEGVKWKRYGRTRTLIKSAGNSASSFISLTCNTDNLKTLSIYLLLKSKPTPFKGDGMKDPSAE